MTDLVVIAQLIERGGDKTEVAVTLYYKVLLDKAGTPSPTLDE